MRSAIFVLCALGSLVFGCRSAEPARDARGTAMAPGPEYFVGTWGVSPASYEDARVIADAVRLAGDGVMTRGTSRGGAFDVLPNPGPSGPGFVARYEITPPETITFYLDGAEEQTRYRVTGPDQWETHSGPPEDVVLYYARRR